MIRKFIFITLFLNTFYSFSHDIENVVYRITLVENTVAIEAEFPWTIRNALLEFQPNLENATSKKDFDDALFRFVKRNLILTDRNSEILDLISITPLPRKEHSHGNEFLLLFEGSDLKEIKNTLLFEYQNKQKNIHKLGGQTFITTINAPSFIISIPSKNKYLWWLSIIPIGFLIYWGTKRQL